METSSGIANSHRSHWAGRSGDSRPRWPTGSSDRRAGGCAGM